MNIGTRINGFEIVNARYAAELRGTLYEMTHIKTGASLVWMDNKEENKIFSLTFKTIPADDTGVFHILEHCVFQGSELYSSHRMFTELLKGSVHTYLNAATYPDRTTFPVGSCSEKDFMNLVGVYLDSTLFPRVLQEPHIFAQEGWHYEIDEEGDLAINGVVYNEMKGMYASSDFVLMEELAAALYKDNGYGKSAGGNPEVIPTLTHQQLCEAHERFYHPSNSIVYLDGDMDIDAVLALIDSYFQRFEARDGVVPFEHQTKGEATFKELDYAARDLSEGAILTCGRLLDGFNTMNDSYAFGVLFDYLAGSNESVLTKAILSRSIAYDVSAYMDANNPDPYISLVMKQLDPERKDEALQVVRDVVADLQDQGFDREELEACIDQLEYRLKDIPEPTGLFRNEMALTGWLYGSDLVSVMCTDHLIGYLRDCIVNGRFMELLREFHFDGAGSAEILMLPSQTREEEEFSEESGRLESIRSSMNTREIEEIREKAKEIEEWQNEPDTQEQIDAIPRLSLEDIEIKKNKIETEEVKIAGRTALLHRTSSNGLTYYRLYFSLADCSVQELQTLSFMTNVMGLIPTTKHDVVTLERMQRRLVGNLDTNVVSFSVRGERESCKPYFEVTFGCLPQYEKEGLDLVAEILTCSDYSSDESKKMQYMIMMQGLQAMQLSLIESGSEFAMRHASSHFYAPAYVGEIVEGYDFYCWLMSFAENYEASFDDYAEAATEAAAKVFCRSRLTISLTSANTHDVMKELAEYVIGAFGEERRREGAPSAASPEDGMTDGEVPGAEDCGACASEIMHIELKDTCSQEIINIPGMVAYAAAAGYSAELEAGYSGGVNALSQIIEFEYLWDRIRTHGGAYGCDIQISSVGIWGMASYRDPSPINSIRVFDETSEFIRGFFEETKDIDKYIIGTFSQVDPLMDGFTRGKRADDDWFGGISRIEREERKLELLHTSAAELEGFEACFQSAPFKCIVCSSELIPAGERETWTVI